MRVGGGTGDSGGRFPRSEPVKIRRTYWIWEALSVPARRSTPLVRVVFSACCGSACGAARRDDAHNDRQSKAVMRNAISGRMPTAYAETEWPKKKRYITWAIFSSSSCRQRNEQLDTSMRNAAVRASCMETP